MVSTMNFIEENAPENNSTQGAKYNETLTGRLDSDRLSHEEHVEQRSEAPSGKRGLGRPFWVGIFIAAVLLACIVVFGLLSRAHATHELAHENKVEAVPEVRVVYPVAGSTGGTLALPGNTQAYVDTPIYSRTN